VINWLTIRRFAELSGYTEDAVRAKMADGTWLSGWVWRKAPDGRILVSIRGYEEWVEGRASAPQVARASRREAKEDAEDGTVAQSHARRPK
jgi:hypothetical protein